MSTLQKVQRYLSLSKVYAKKAADPRADTQKKDYLVIASNYANEAAKLLAIEHAVGHLNK
jgi:hypothetical protein